MARRRQAGEQNRSLSPRPPKVKTSDLPDMKYFHCCRLGVCVCVVFVCLFFISFFWGGGGGMACIS